MSSDIGALVIIRFLFLFLFFFGGGIVYYTYYNLFAEFIGTKQCTLSVP